MMVPAEHDRADFTVAHHTVEAECDIQPPFRILVEDACLCADHEPVLPGITNPVVVIHVLSAPAGIDTIHSGTVGLHQIFLFPAQAYPAERPVAVIEQLRPHDIFDIRGPDKTVFLIDPVPGDFLHAGIIDGFHKRVPVIEKVSAASHQFPDYFEMPMQGAVDQRAETVYIVGKEFRTFGKGDAGRAVTSFINGMAGGLVAQQVDPDRLRIGKLQQVDYIALIGNRNRFLCLHSFLCHAEGFCFIFGHILHPALRIASFDAGAVHFGNNAGGAGYNGRFRLRPAHTPESGGNKEMSAQVLILRNA